MEYLLVLLFIAATLGWIFLWVHTYHPKDVKHLLLHTGLFLLLSLVICGVIMLLIFLPADDSYSASNLGALGLMFLMFLRVFGIGCLVAICQTVGVLSEKRQGEQETESEHTEDNLQNHED